MSKGKFTIASRLRSFAYAFRGIRELLVSEHNAWIHSIAAFCVVALGIGIGISRMEWVTVVILIGLVFAAEAFNSAIERLADVISPTYNEHIKQAKDLAAGAVLFVAIAAAIGGMLIFIPYFL